MNIQLEPFFNQSVDCLCIADYDGYFVKINPAFVALLGYSEEELHSKKISEYGTKTKFYTMKQNNDR